MTYVHKWLAPEAPKSPTSFYYSPPSLSCIHSSNHPSIAPSIKPIVSGKGGPVFVTMHIIFICYMPASCRKSPLPKPRSSLHLWIRPPPPPLLLSMQSFLHPSIPHSSFLQTNRLKMGAFFIVLSMHTLGMCYGRASCRKNSTRGSEVPLIFGLDPRSLL
jgi:hypothetical protein